MDYFSPYFSEAKDVNISVYWQWNELAFFSLLVHRLGTNECQIFLWQTNPLMIRVETKAGHGAHKPTSKVVSDCDRLMGTRRRMRKWRWIRVSVVCFACPESRSTSTATCSPSWLATWNCSSESDSQRHCHHCEPCRSFRIHRFVVHSFFFLLPSSKRHKKTYQQWSKGIFFSRYPSHNKQDWSTADVIATPWPFYLSGRPTRIDISMTDNRERRRTNEYLRWTRGRNQSEWLGRW